MQTLTDGVNGLGLLVTLNWDRILYVVATGLALCGGAVLGTALTYFS